MGVHQLAGGIGLPEKIRHANRDCLSRHNAPEKLQRAVQVGSPVFRLEKQNLTNDAQHVKTPFAGRHVFLDLVGKQNQPHLVVVADGGKRQHRGQLSRHLALGLLDRAEKAGPAQVDQQHQRQLAFLGVHLYERLIHPGGHVPVDRSNLVAGRVLAHLLEVQPLPLERAVVLPGQRLGHETLSAQLNLPDFLENLLRDHGDTIAAEILTDFPTGV